MRGRIIKYTHPLDRNQMTSMDHALMIPFSTCIWDCARSST